MNQYLLSALTWLLLFGKAFPEEKKLLFVQILTRHGDRSPIMLYPNDPNPASFWVEGFKALTLLGRKQQFALGKYFRSRYETFSTFSPLEVNVMSSEPNRCIMSAASNMASFFAPNPEWAIDSTLPWQPIPIHYLEKKYDKLLSHRSECPRAEEEEKRVTQSPESQRLLNQYKEMFKNLSILSGFTIEDWSKPFFLYDTINIEKKYNLTVPTWIEPYWDALTYLSGISFFWKYNSPLLLHLRAGPLVQKIIDMMKKKINGEIPNLKFQFYSSHETFLAVVLMALNKYNMIQPPYCASLIIELFEMTDGMKTVRFLYQNSSTPEEKIDPPQIFIFDGCTEFCPLDYFVNYTKYLIPEDWDRECQLPKSFVEIIEEKRFTILLVIVLIPLSVFLLWKMFSRRKKHLEYHPID